MHAQETLDLERIRKLTLRRAEDSIIIALFERSQYKINDVIYKTHKKGGIEIPGFDGSFLDYFLWETEQLHARLGRYESPDEIPFFDNPPQPVVKREKRETPLKAIINVNPRIKEIYLKAVKQICEKGDDMQYGSAALCDINALQTISRRVHLGMFVAEGKFRDDPEGYAELIARKDSEAIQERLTNTDVEKEISARVFNKGEKYGINPKFIAAFYKGDLIPLTKDVEVMYLLKRGTQS